MVWSPEIPEGAESYKIRHMIVPYTRGVGLDLGCGPYKAWPHFISVDDVSQHNYRGRDLDWRPDLVASALDLPMFADRGLDFVFSSHLLEHVEDTEAALKEWWRVIKIGGHLVLYLPHADAYPNIGEPGHNPDHKHDFRPQDIIDVMGKVGSWDLVECQDRFERDEYSFYMVFEKMAGTRRKQSWKAWAEDPRPTCLVIRYGGFGDILQAETVFHGLKEQGYRTVFNVSEKGREIAQEDPFVDRFWQQDTDQVPSELLNGYWTLLGREFDKVVNLSGSVEDTLLPPPGKRNHAMPQPARHMLMNLNYLEFTAALADIPTAAPIRFYPSTTEANQAAAFKSAFMGRPAILWSLAGSSIHKTWPWAATCITWLLEQTDATVVLVGNRDCQLLEMAIAQPAAEHFLKTDYGETTCADLGRILMDLKAHFGRNRILCKSGNWSIRETLAFAREADVVVGPETGVLNAVAMDDSVAKVIMLSHSSHENLTRDWLSTVAIEPPDVECYPCHRLHYGREFCPEDKETGASVCAAAIHPEMVFDAIIGFLREMKRAVA